MFPTHVARSERCLDKSLGLSQPSDYYRESAEVRVEREGHIWSWASVEGIGVHWSKTSLDFSGNEWIAFRWLRTNAKESRDPNEENTWVDVNFELKDPVAAEEFANQIMHQINSRLLVTFEFRGSETWVEERDPQNVYDDVDMVRVYYSAHIDFPWFVNELENSLPREMGGIAANIDVTGADEAWFEIQHHQGDSFSVGDDQFFEQIGVGFNSFISELEGGHELAMENLLHLARIERSEYSEDSWYSFNLPDVDILSTEPPIGDYGGYAVHEDRWYEGWQNAWRHGVNLDIRDPMVSFDSFRVRFDYQFVPRALQTHEHAEMSVDPFGNLEVRMGLADPSASLTQTIDYENDPLYEFVENLHLRVEGPKEQLVEAPISSNTSLAAQVIRQEPNIFLDIDFVSDDPEYSSIADAIAAAYGVDLDVEFHLGNEDFWDGGLHVHYYGWVDWNIIIERAKKPELISKSALYNHIDFGSAPHIENNIHFEAPSRLPEKGIGVDWWLEQYFSPGENYISTQNALNGYAPLRKLPEVDSSHFRIEVPGRVLDVTPNKDKWGQGYDVWHNEWEDEGIPKNQFELQLFNESVELTEFGVLFEFDFIKEGTDIRAPEIDFQYPIQGDRVSGTIEIEIMIRDPESGVRDDSVRLEIGSKYLLIDWTELNLEKQDNERWTAMWDTTKLGGDGTYNLRVSALDNAGHRAKAEVSVEVDNLADDNKPPMIEIIEPLKGDTVSGEVTILAKVYDPMGLQFVSLTIDGLGYPMEQKETDEYSFTWDSTTRADGEHLIVVIAIGMDGEEAKVDSIIVTDNGITENVPPSELEQEAAFFVPGFTLLDVVMALSVFGLLLMTRKKHLV